MGLDANGTKFLLFALQNGVAFHDTATIGRQSLNLDSAALHRNFQLAGDPISKSTVDGILADSNGYCEQFLDRLGAKSVTSFDASAYENASVVYDFNLPIRDEFKNRFSAVLDGGTLEHVFNYPVALKNCMEMVRPAGHFLAITPANNFLGHGFYQFSPELFFNVLDRQNGFALEHMIIFEDVPDSPWFRVTDPRSLGGRITLQNGLPAYLLIIARKVADVPIFAEFPQQSDYAAAWAEHSITETRNGNGGLMRKIAVRLKRRLRRFAGELGSKPDQFTKIDPFGEKTKTISSR